MRLWALVPTLMTFIGRIPGMSAAAALKIPPKLQVELDRKKARRGRRGSEAALA